VIYTFLFCIFRFWNDINQTQYDTLEKFKEKILADGLLNQFGNFDDLYLLRFLRARKFDLDKTFLMFKTFLKWRIDNGVDEIEVNFYINKISLKQ
jgi:hypothetical protein